MSDIDRRWYIERKIFPNVKGHRPADPGTAHTFEADRRALINCPDLARLTTSKRITAR